MKIKKAFKFRLKPNESQRAMLEKYVGACRFVWNKVLRMSLDRLQAKQSIIWYLEADYWSKQWKRSDEYTFLKEVPAHCLQQKLKDLDRAFKDGFDQHQPLKRLPKFKKRGLGDSIRFPEPKQIQIENRRIKFPKLGWMGFFKSQGINGQLRNATIVREGGWWFVSLQVEQEIEIICQTTQSSIGIDMGITHFASLSDGRQIGPISAFKQHQIKLAKLQKGLSRKRRFSMNWQKQKHKIQQLHRKIAHIRQDFLHKLSTDISKNHAMVVLEALKVSQMSASSKGSLEKPGKNVKAKSQLNRSILDQGWFEFKRQLKYKLEWLGKILLEINPAYTSQQCTACGYIARANRKSQSEFSCQSCGHEDHADINAAKNILARGLDELTMSFDKAAGHVVLACGEAAIVTSMKQESPGKGNLLPA